MAQHGSIGIDIGGTKTLVSLFNDQFKLVDMVKFKTEAGQGERKFDERLTDAVKGLLKRARREELAVIATGIGCAGRIDYASLTLKVSPNIPFLKDYPLRQKIGKLTETDVFLGNDAHMGLYGEQQLGAAVGVQHVLGIFVGTGLGGAMIIEGKLHLGTGGVAGDIGNYLVQPFGPLVGSDRMGVLDDVASRTAIAAAAAAYASKQWAPNLLAMAGTDLAQIRSSTLAKSIKKGDKQIEELVRSRGHIIGIALSNLVDFINPDMVVLGGGLIDEMPALLGKEIEQGIQEHATQAAREKLKVVISKLKDQAVAVGAAKMAWDRFITKEKASEGRLTKGGSKKV